MTELKQTTKIVKAILEENKQTRNSDSLLYMKVLEYIDNVYGTEVCKLPVHVFLSHMNEFDVPGFETVRRTRQRIQQTCPELAACEPVVAQRLVNEEKFRAYARAWRCVE